MPGGLRSRSAVGPAATWVWAARGRVKVLGQGGLEGSSPRFLLGYAAVRGKAEELPASEVESPWNRAPWGDKVAADADPVHCKACECQTAGSSHCLPPGPVAAIPFPPGDGGASHQRPTASRWWGFGLGVWPNNVVFLRGHRAAPPRQSSMGRSTGFEGKRVCILLVARPSGRSFHPWLPTLKFVAGI